MDSNEIKPGSSVGCSGSASHETLIFGWYMMGVLLNFCGSCLWDEFKFSLWMQAHPDLIHAFQAAAAAGGSGASGAASNKPVHTGIGSETLPRGRGVDERAARAAAEVRKKAAARGLLIRPHGVPVQALPPLTQLLNIINSGMTPDGVNNEVTNGEKKESNGHASNEPQVPEEDQSKPVEQDQTPVGLGSGLAALDAKKQKTKAKATS